MSKPWRLPILLVLPVLAVGGLVAQSRHDDAPAPDVRLAELTPTAAAPGTLSSTWYCAAGSATGVTSGEGAGPAEQQVIVSNASDTEAVGRITIVPDEGESKTVPVTVAPHSRSSLTLSEKVKAAWASALVEVSGGEVTVAHQLRGPDGRSVSDCASTPSSSWYFPGGSTASGAGLWLALFNPFPGDATVDVAFDSDEGARTPPKFQGIVVPSRRVKVLKVSDTVTLRPNVSTTVSVRSGRIVAEMVQSDNGREDIGLPKGLTATTGAAQASPTWFFPMSAPPGVNGSERIWLFNPGDTDSQVRVQVQLDQPATNGTVEPFEYSVPAHRMVAVTITDALADPATADAAENRVPKGIPHWVIVESLDGADIVAQRMLTGPDRQGVTYAMGIPVVATRWLVPVAGVAALDGSLVAVANPSATQTATVTLRRQGDGSEADVAGSTVSIPPGEFVVFDLKLAGLIEGANAAELVSDQPVVVGQWMGFSEPRDIATPLGIPIVGTQSLPVDVIDPGVAPQPLDPSTLPPDSTLVEPGTDDTAVQG